MNTITIILLISAALLALSVISLTKSIRRFTALRYDSAKLATANAELRCALSKARAKLADLKAQAPKTVPIPDKVRVSNVIQSVTRYTGRSYAEVAAELRQYPSEKIGRHWYYDRTQAEAIREIYKPKKSNK